MDLNRLRHFIAVAKAGSYRKAAADLQISQPALTLSIQKLEAELEVKLLDRTRRGVTTTVFGDTVLARAMEILSDVSRLSAEVDDLKGLKSGTVDVGVGPNISRQHIAELVAGAHDKRSGLKINIHTGFYYDHLSAIRRNELDLMIGRLPDGPVDPDIKFKHMMDDPYVVVLGADHPLAGTGMLDPVTAKHHHWIGSVNLQLVDPDALKFIGFDIAERQTLNVTDLDIVHRLLLTGRYLAIWPMNVFRGSLDNGALKYLSIPQVNGVDLLCRTGIAHRADKPLSPAAEFFASMALEQLSAPVT